MFEVKEKKLLTVILNCDMSSLKIREGNELESFYNYCINVLWPANSHQFSVTL